MTKFTKNKKKKKKKIMFTSVLLNYMRGSISFTNWDIEIKDLLQHAVGTPRVSVMRTEDQ